MNKTLDLIRIITIFAQEYNNMSFKKVKDVVDLLQTNGFKKVRQKGSHMVYTDGLHVVIVPDHGSKGIEKGTYYNILRQAGIKEKQI